MFAPIFNEALESRLLLSASSLALSAAVQADHLQVQIDLLQFRSDCLGFAATALSDTAAIKAADPRQATTVVPLIKTMKSDLTAMRTALLADRLTEAQNVLKDETAIVGVKEKILADKGSKTAEATDHANLLADRIQLQNDMIAGLNTRIATRTADYGKLFADGQAITAAVQTDANASVALQAAVKKWISDVGTRLNTLEADLTTLAAARTQLAADLTAAENS